MPEMIPWPSRTRLLLILGDALVILLTAITGFAQHGELATAGAGRIAATVVPFEIAWFVTAPWLACFDESRPPGWRNLWRPLLAAVLAAPLGAVLRGLWLGAPVMPVFAVVMGAVLGAAMVVWRGLAMLVGRQRASTAG